MGTLGNQPNFGVYGFTRTQAESFNGTGSATSFTLGHHVKNAIDIEVLVDNVQQSPFDGSYSVSGTTLTFSGAPASGTNNVYVMYRQVGTVIDTQALVPDDSSVTYAKLSNDIPLGNRNLVINGAMQVAQRGTTFDYDTPSGNKYTTCDRFSIYKSSGTYSLTNTQSTDAPVGFSHSYKVVCDAVYTPSASDNIGINQNIEVSNRLQEFGFGTSEAKDITFSFYVKGTPKTYTFQTNYVGTDGEQKSQNKAFTVTSTWTRKVITFSAGGTSSSVGIEPDQTSAGMNFRVWLAAGPNDIASEITTWTANPPPTYEAATGQGNFFSAVGNEFLITGIQLEVGNKVTPFEHKSYVDELAACQRYFYRHADDTSRRTVAASFRTTASNVEGLVTFPCTMRASPSLISTSGTDYYRDYCLGNGTNTTGVTAHHIYLNNAVLQWTGHPRTAGQAGYMRTNNASATIDFDAEI